MTKRYTGIQYYAPHYRHQSYKPHQRFDGSRVYAYADEDHTRLIWTTDIEYLGVADERVVWTPDRWNGGHSKWAAELR